MLLQGQRELRNDTPERRAARNTITGGRTPGTDLSQQRATAAHHEREGVGLPPAEPAQILVRRASDVTAARRGDALADLRVRGLERWRKRGVR
ncbi:hypothetical protein STEG23_001025 [Scotinomys teguina]